MADFNQYLKKEGISPNSEKAQFLGAIYGQESGSGSNTRTSNQGAVGGMQIIPSTFASVADKGWDINNPEQSARAGIRYGSQLYDKYGAERAAVGYYSGDKGVEAYDKGVYYRDKKNPSAPNTKEYAQSVLGRMGGGGAGGAGGASEDYSFETIMKDYKPSDKTVPSTVSKTVPPEDYSFETIMKDYKPPGETVPKTVSETVPSTGSETPIVDAARMGLNSLVKGAAGSVDAILNAPRNVANLGTAGVNMAANKLFGVPAEQLQSVTIPQNTATNYLTNAGLISNEQKLMPTSTGGRVADTVLQGIGSGMGFSKNLLQTAGMAGAAVVGQGVTEATGNPLLGIAAGIVAPTAAKGALTAATAGGAVAKRGITSAKDFIQQNQMASSNIAAKKILKGLQDKERIDYSINDPITMEEMLMIKGEIKDIKAAKKPDGSYDRTKLSEDYKYETAADLDKLVRGFEAYKLENLATVAKDIKQQYVQQAASPVEQAIGAGIGGVAGSVGGALTGGTGALAGYAATKAWQGLNAVRRQQVTNALTAMENPDALLRQFERLNAAGQKSLLDELATIGSTANLKSTALKAARGQIPVANKLTQQQD